MWITGRSVQERFADRPLLSQLKELGERRGDVRESGARPERATIITAQHHERDLFPRVIGAVMCRIVSMIGRDDDEIIALDPLEEIAEPEIKFEERARVSRKVPPMAVEHVEIDEVGENESVVRALPQFVDHSRPLGIGCGRLLYRNKTNRLSFKNVISNGR